MSDAVDTSTKGVEQTCAGLRELNAYLRLRETPDTNGNIGPIHATWLQIAEDLLRALAAERDNHLRETRDIAAERDAYLHGNRLYIQWGQSQDALLKAVRERDALRVAATALDAALLGLLRERPVGVGDPDHRDPLDEAWHRLRTVLEGAKS